MFMSYVIRPACIIPVASRPSGALIRACVHGATIMEKIATHQSHAPGQGLKLVSTWPTLAASVATRTL